MKALTHPSPGQTGGQMIPAENFKIRFGWAPDYEVGTMKDTTFYRSGYTSREVAPTGVARLTESGIYVATEIMKSPQGHVIGEPGDLFMENKTIGDHVIVGLATIHRALRAMMHAASSDARTGRKLKWMGSTLGLETVRSQLLTRENKQARKDYERRMRQLLQEARGHLGTSEHEDVLRLLDRLERAGEDTDSLGRFNRCALPLVLRLVQRLSAVEYQRRELRARATQQVATSLASSIDILDAVTEMCATQFMAIARSPGLQPERWKTATERERREFEKRLRVARDRTIPDLIAKMERWFVPEPYRSTFEKATRYAGSLVLQISQILDKTQPEGHANLLHRTSLVAAQTARILAIALLINKLQAVMLPLGIMRRNQDDRLRVRSIVQEVEPLAPILVWEINDLEEAFGQLEENPLDNYQRVMTEFPGVAHMARQGLIEIHRTQGWTQEAASKLYGSLRELEQPKLLGELSKH